MIGRSLSSFSYPFGFFGASTPRLVRDAGYDLACTARAGSVTGTTDPYLIPRLHVRNWNGEEFHRRFFCRL
jgi:hypothetical protein